VGAVKFLPLPGCTIEARHKEYMRSVHLNQLEKSAVAKHLINTANYINFDSTSKLGMAVRYMDCLVKEAIEIWLHSDFNRDKGFNLSHTWRPLIRMLVWSGDTPVGMKGRR
jgi:hypothetical protein